MELRRGTGSEIEWCGGLLVVMLSSVVGVRAEWNHRESLLGSWVVYGIRSWPWGGGDRRSGNPRSPHVRATAHPLPAALL